MNLKIECLRLARAHHGNTDIHMRTNFTTMVCKFEKWRRKSAGGNFFVHGCYGNGEIHMRTEFHFHALHGVQV